ncbi:MAG: transposase [Pseudomonas sp.]|nr:transposase [Pseudomonas sp.]
MEYDDKLIEDAVLALLATFSSDNGNAWKGFDFETMDRWHEHGFISDPVNKNKSIWLTAEGLERGRQIADRLFGARTQVGHASTLIPDFMLRPRWVHLSIVYAVLSRRGRKFFLHHMAAKGKHRAGFIIPPPGGGGGVSVGQ